MDYLINAVNLGRRFKANVAVSSLNLHVAPGEILGLLGPNGAGKTTTMQMLAAMLAPTEGSATVAGFDVVTHANDVRKNVGIMLDEPGFYQEMALDDYLLFFARLYGFRKAEVMPHLLELLERFRLMDKRTAKLDSLSKGMRQKVSLARALLHKPQVLLLDEPTSALDPLSALAVHEYIQERRRDGAAIIISTHNLPEAEQLSDRIAIVARGRLRKLGTQAALRRRDDGLVEYEVKLAGPQNGHVAVLDRVGVTDIRVIDATDREHILAYRTDNPYRANAAIVSGLVAHGVDIVSVESRPCRLSDVYLKTIAEAEE